MPLGNFSRRGGGAANPTDPQEIFNKLTLRGQVENLWGPQTAALGEWNTHRAETDVTIEMPTGGGKTLVGLLVAQSISNELKGRVLYVCPNIQLVEQTARKASEVGLTVATYTKKTWEHKDEFLKGEAPCVTTYAAAFHPFSNLLDGLEALIIDDAHVAVGELKSRFTLTIDAKDAAFTPLKTVLQGYAVSVGRGGRFDEALRGDGNGLCFLPSFTTSKNATYIQSLLVKHGVKDRHPFVWEYLADKLDRCLFFVGDRRIAISPPLPPLDSIKALSASARRVYLTATLPSPYEAARVFGDRISARRISPVGKLGAAQKMLAFIHGDVVSQRMGALALIAKRKACVVVPSRVYAKKNWSNFPVYGKDDGETGLDNFREAPAPAKLVLAGRFDGIDLPGDSCRILVLDGLPRGSHLLDRFLAESIRSRELRAANTATKIVQAIGRIFRSNTDHGAVLLVGDDLQRWLMDHYNQGFLPHLLQQQVALGLDIRAEISDSKMTFIEVLDGVLQATSDWDRLYRENAEQYPTVNSSFDPEMSKAFGMEHLAGRALWDGNFAEAAQRYQEAATTVATKEPGLSGWFLHLAALAVLRQGDEGKATALFYDAAAARSDFGRPPWPRPDAGPGTKKPGEQAQRIAALLDEPVRFNVRLKAVLDNLTYEASAAQLEEAVCDLGKLMGLDAERPDNTRQGPKKVKTGPDVVWIAPWRAQGAWFEAKTDKLVTSQYTKTEIGQCHDHAQWLLTNKAGITFSEFILGRHLPVTPQANPSLELKVVELEEMVRLAMQLEDLTTSALGGPAETRASLIDARLLMDGMRWPSIIEGIDARYVSDLQSEPPSQDSDD